MATKTKKYPYVTRAKIKKAFNWFLKKEKVVEIEYYYTNSLCMEQKRKYRGILTDVKIIPVRYYVDQTIPPEEYKIVFEMTEWEEVHKSDITSIHLSNAVFEETIPNDAEVHYNHGKFVYEWCNSGPYCHLSIDFDRKRKGLSAVAKKCIGDIESILEGCSSK